MSKAKPNLEVHPELDGYLFPLDPDEFRQLRSNLERDGECLDPILFWEDGNRRWILDGSNRWAICEELNVPYTIQRLDVSDLAAAKVWMIEHQLGRRNWSQSQIAAITAKRLALVSGTDKPSMRKAAAKAGISLPDLSAATVVETEGTDEEKASVATGETHVRAAAAKIKQREADEPAPAAPNASIKDELGDSVPEELRGVFESRNVFDKILNLITKINRQANPLLGDPAGNLAPADGGMFFADHRQAFRKAITDARSFVKFARPYAICPVRHGKNKCDCCRGKGWITEEIYKRSGKK